MISGAQLKQASKAAAQRPGDTCITSGLAPKPPKAMKQNLLISTAMGILLVTAFCCLITSYRPSTFRAPYIAHASLGDYMLVTATFLIAPFIGACHAWRLTRANRHPSAIVGWLTLIAFLFVLLTCCLLFWCDYRRLMAAG